VVVKFFVKAQLNQTPLGHYIRTKVQIVDLDTLKNFLDLVHARIALLERFSADYPVVDLRELLPSFDPQFTEYKNLPGFSMIALGRQIDYQAEPFQFDLLPHHDDPLFKETDQVRIRRRPQFQGLTQAAALVREQLPDEKRDEFTAVFQGRDLTSLARYPQMLPFLFEMDRAHLIAADPDGVFRLRGVFASFPSNLDAEIKGFGRRIGKFSAHDTQRYVENRRFVYKFLMETYGFPIASERRTSAALFARKLCRLKQAFLIKVLGQSDRTITTLYHPDPRRLFPQVEKTALVQLDSIDQETHNRLRRERFYVDAKRRVALVRVVYDQRRYHPRNIIEDRALSVTRQEIIHPSTAQVISDVNFLQDKTNLVLVLTDIIRGEYHGQIAYHDRETVRGTRAHLSRLKFLAAWIEKHERRLVDYADDTFDAVETLLKSYILDPGNVESFKAHLALHREVLSRLVHLKQARTLRQLEELVRLKTKSGSKMNYLEFYRAVLDLIDTHRDFILSFYTHLFDKAMSLLDTILADPYVINRYVKLTGRPQTDYARRIREGYQSVAAARIFLEQRYRQAFPQGG
jgi:hypothetical protein